MNDILSRLGRFWPGFVAFLLPLVFSLGVMQYNVRLVLPDPDLWRAVTIDAMNPADYERFAHDLEARFVYGTVNAFGQLAAFAGTLLAGAVLARLFGWRAAIVILVAAAAFGVFVSYHLAEQQDLIRSAILDKTLQSAQEAGFTFAGSVESLWRAIQLNMSVGLAGTAALLSGFGAVAVRTRLEEFQSPDWVARQLRLRLQYLSFLTLAGAAILVLLVAANKVSLGWPQGLMKPEPAKSYAVLTAAVANYWGGIGTGVLLCALIPALISIRLDIAKAAEYGCADYSKQDEWRKKNALVFAPSAVVTAALTTAAPLFAGPAIDVVRALLGGS